MIISPDYQKPLAEIGQSFAGQFSFAVRVGDDVKRLHEYVKCRDFLGDILWYNRYGKPTEIYGFKSDDTRIIDKSRTCLLFKGSPSTIDILVRQVKTVVHPIERANKLKLTKITPLLAYPGECIIDADKFWQKTIWLISFYTFLIKVAAHHWVGDWKEELCSTESNEYNYFRGIKGYFHPFSTKLKKITGRYKSVTGHPVKQEKNFDIHKIHNECGFVSLTRIKNWGYATDNVYIKNMRKEIV
jgi:hypothetical protein